MVVNWKALKEIKQQELPAAEADRKARIEKITDKVEKRIFRQCKYQEAGTSVNYSIPNSGEGFTDFWCYFFDLDDWRWDEDIKAEVGQKIVDRLTAQGIDCKPVKGWHRVEIRLP